MLRKLMMTIIVGLLMTPIAVLAGGAQQGETMPAEQAEVGNEAPMLAQMVAAGELPPLEKRLPENPYVLNVVDEIGTYGGTLRRGYTGPEDLPGPQKLNRVGFVEFGPDGKTIEPSMVESYTTSEDGLTFTFQLRRGLRWSDGEPFTVDDIAFAYEHVAMNEELSPTAPPRLRVGDEIVEFQVISDHTFRFVLPAPSATFLQNLATEDGWGATTPAHYLKQFHASFADPGDIEAMVRAEDMDTWVQLFEAKADEWQNPEKPSMRAWVLQDRLGGEVARMVRNPYYWRVDPEGNQLPYIDMIENRLFLDTETLILSILSGDIDFQTRHIPWGQYAILMENRDRGNYEVLEWPMSWGSFWAFMPNLNSHDPKLNELFNDRRFRIALSHAIDRDELNEVLFLGAGKPRAATVVPESPFYEPDLEMMYAEYDPAKSEQLFREIGLSRSGDGYWNHKDGSRLSFVVNGVPEQNWPDILEMTSEMWNRVGLRNEVVLLDRSLNWSRFENAEFDINGWAWGRGFAPLIGPKFVFPSDTALNPAPLWGAWYQSNGETGVEPPEDHPVRTAMELYDRYVVEPNAQRRLEIGKELVRLSTEQIWSIGTVGEIPDPAIRSRRLRNVPDVVLSEHLLMTPSNANVEQFFFLD